MEPLMLKQRPSSSQSQDSSHILRSTFRDLFSQGGMREDLIENLTTTKSGEDAFHDKYVEKLQTIHSKWTTKISAIDNMINHLDTAKNQARLLEQEEEEKAKEEYALYQDLGLPSVPSRLDQFLDNHGLKENNLIIPNELLEYGMDTSSDITKQSIPQYASTTFSSRQLFDKIPKKDNYLPEAELILPKESKVGQDKKKFQTRKCQLTVSQSEKNVWRQCITPKQREEEKKEIMKLQQRADFLKNPRFTQNTRSLINGTDSQNTIEQESYFEADPNPVQFNDYEVGKIYQIKLELKNITAASRQLRLIEPSTPFFSIGKGDFPSANGLIAPGMCFPVTVKFSPQTLEDYDDKLEIKTMGIAPLIIPLQGRREPPSLTLPENVDIGHCLIGDSKSMEFVMDNNGGQGRFCFVLGEICDQKNNADIAWDELDYDFKEELNMDSEFLLSPKCFSLKAKESHLLKVNFKPTSVKKYTQNIVLFCDNGAVTQHQLSGVGEIADVQLSYLEGGLEESQFGETEDIDAKQISRFENCYPTVMYTRKIKIQNKVSVPVEFEWNLSFPKVCETESETQNRKNDNNNSTFINEEPPVFEIHPSSGIFNELSIHDFQVVFSPSRVGDWFRVLTLHLKNIPIKDSDSDSFQRSDEKVVDISLKGHTQPYIVTANLAVVTVDGKNYQGIPRYRTVKLVNQSDAIARYQWETVNTDDCTVTVEPSQGEIDGANATEFLVSILGKRTGKFEIQVPYHVESSFADSCLYIKANFVGADLCIEEMDTNFGLLKLGDYVEKEITLSNTCPIDASWNIVCHPKQQESDKILTITPNKGVLPAHCKETIKLLFYPDRVMSFNGRLACYVTDSQPCFHQIFGEVQRPNVYASLSSIVIPRAFLDCPLEAEVTLCNGGWLEAKCCFRQCDADSINVQFEKEEFTLQPQEKLTVKLSMTCHKLGEMEAFIVCDVEDMLEPVVVQYIGDVQGLLVDITIPNIQDIENQSEVIGNNDTIEFGRDVLLGQLTDVLLVIENRSEISAQFDLKFQEFQSSRLPTPPSNGFDGKRYKRTMVRSLSSKTSSLFRNKTDCQMSKEFSDATLRHGRGLALMCTPSCGTLSAYERRVITVSCQSDIWGDYNDLLLCKIGDSIEKLIPVHVDILGTPLNFQMTKEHPPIVRFGTHPSFGPIVKRSLRINNTSYVDIRLDWETFVIEDDDDQLIDLDCYFGQPFPLLDTNGDEIVGGDSLDESDESGGLVKCIIKEHEGQRTENPFKVVNRQMIVPGQGHALLEVSFTPPSFVKDEEHYLGYALGYMSLMNKDKVGEDGCFVRNDGLDMLPFGVNMTSCVLPPKLMLEACDEEEFFFELNATDLLDTSTFTLRDRLSMSRRFVLNNGSCTTVNFSCDIQQPFHIEVTKEKLSTGTKGCKKKTGTGDRNKNRFSLKPNANLEVLVWFDLTSDLIGENTNGDKIVNHEKDLVVLYDDKNEQRYPVTAMVHYPCLTLLQDVIDFGTCFVNEKRQKVLKISNDSKAMLYWNIKIDESCSKAARDAFQVNTEDMMKDQQNRVMMISNDESSSHHSTEVVVEFTAKHNIEYESRIIVTSLFNEKFLNHKGFVIIVRGHGSYDEATKE